MAQRVPRWRVLTDDYRAQIESGALAEGEPFPSRSQLRKDRGVHANTASRILRELEAEGYLRVETGKRTVVLGPHKPLERTRGAPCRGGGASCSFSVAAR